MQHCFNMCETLVGDAADTCTVVTICHISNHYYCWHVVHLYTVFPAAVLSSADDISLDFRLQKVNWAVQKLGTKGHLLSRVVQCDANFPHKHTHTHSKLYCTCLLHIKSLFTAHHCKVSVLGCYTT